MAQYLRDRTKGGTWLFTSCIESPGDFALTDHIEQLRKSFHCVMRVHPWHIDAIVVLPDRIQTIWTLPSGDTNYSGRWSAIKANFSRSLPKTEYISPVRAKRGERGIWQKRFFERRIRDHLERDALIKQSYRLPVLLGLANDPADWPWSSYHRDLRHGLLKPKAEQSLEDMPHTVFAKSA